MLDCHNKEKNILYLLFKKRNLYFIKLLFFRNEIYTYCFGSSKGIGVEMAYMHVQKRMNLLFWWSLPNENLSKITQDISHNMV